MPMSTLPAYADSTILRIIAVLLLYAVSRLVLHRIDLSELDRQGYSLEIGDAWPCPLSVVPNMRVREK